MEYPGGNSFGYAWASHHKYRNSHVVYLRITNRSSILWKMSLFSTDIDVDSIENYKKKALFQMKES